MEFLNNINALLINSMGPLGPLIALGGVGLVLIIATLPIMLKKKIDPFAKVKAQRAPLAAAKKPGDALRKGEKNDKLQKFANFLEPQNAADMSTARMKMLRVTGGALWFAGPRPRRCPSRGGSPRPSGA